MNIEPENDGVWNSCFQGYYAQVRCGSFQKIGVPQNGWFIMENPIKMADLGGTIIFFKHPCQSSGVKTQNHGSREFFFQLRWVYTGFKLFGADVRASYFLTKRVFKGAAAKMTKVMGVGKGGFG